MTNFSTLGLAAPILKALESEGYTAPTPIQAKAIPAVLTGSDLLGIAQTGTGKTAAFALPILHRLAASPRPATRKGCRALILSPTRELASQIAESFKVYGRHLGLTVAVVFGGVTPRKQIRDLSKGVDILIATPGRLLDHMGQKAIVLSGTEIFVLDEADQMLDLGFLKPIERIAANIPKARQTLFFSATMPKPIATLARDFLDNPVCVSVAPVASTAERVGQRIIHIESHRKRDILTSLCADPAMQRTLVFTRTKRGADRVAKHLEGSGVAVAAIHGNKSQGQRERALSAFRSGRIRILVATDIAARGIDVDNVSHVVNFELPEVPEAYVHRIGRTGRAGASGIAISFCDRSERDLLRAIEKLTNQSIPSENLCDGSFAPAPANGSRARNGSGQNRSRHNARPKKGQGQPRRNREHNQDGQPGQRGHEAHASNGNRSSQPGQNSKPDQRQKKRQKHSVSIAAGNGNSSGTDRFANKPSNGTKAGDNSAKPGSRNRSRSRRPMANAV